MKRLFTLLTLLCGVAASNFTIAQSAKLWQSIEPYQLQTHNMRDWIPNQYRALTLNKTAMQNFLANAPMEFSVEINQSPLVLELPMPYGGFQKFHIVESPIMAPALAAKYPNIKTYLGQGIDDPTAVIRCDVTVWGFHAFVLSANGTVFISPYSLESDAEYIAYYKHDLPPNPNPHFCEFDAEKADVSLEDVERTIEVAPAQTENPASAMRDNGSQLRNYRLALACTEEYAAKFPNSTSATKATVLAAMVTSVNRVNTVYEVDFAVRLTLIPNNDTLIFLPGSGDPYSNTNGGTMLGQNQTTVTARIGTANYDIGHVFSTGGGGIAGLGVICKSNSKANGVTGSPTPYGDGYDIDYVAHEMGHQFGGNHTFNSTTGSCSGNRSANAAYEPGSATTIMGYAGICNTTTITNDLQPHSDAYFHAKSLDEIWTYINTGTGNTCPVKTTLTNQIPLLTILGNPSYSIPVRTPFRLNAFSVDPDNDAVTYCWEQYDLGSASNWNAPTGNAPIFRSFNPSTIGTRIFPQMSDILNNVTTIGEIKPRYARTMHFRCSVRDNKAGGGAVTFNDNLAVVDVINTTDSFSITMLNTAGITLQGNSVQNVTWTIAQSDVAPINCKKVNILYSTDNGINFQTLVANTDNDGSELVTLPNIATSKARIMVEAADNIFFDVNNQKFSVVFINTGIENSLSEGSVQIYPNPSTALFNVETILAKEEVVNLTVTNMLGQEIKTDSFWHTEKYTLNLEHYPSGVYFVKVKTNTGSLVKKIVKE